MKVLVTGGTGFLGSHIVKELISKGNEVSIFYKEGSSTINVDDLNVNLHSGDITNLEAVKAAMKNCNQVFHVVGTMMYTRLKKFRQIQYNVNVKGTKTVVDAVLELGIERLIYTSTVNSLGYPEQKGLDTEPGDEETEFNWQKYKLSYFDTKKEAEDHVLNMVEKEGLPAIALLPTTMFGPNDYNFNAGEYIQRIHESGIPGYTPGGTNVVDVRNVAKGHVLAAEKGKIGETYILGSEQNYSYKQIFEEIAEVIGSKVPKRKIPYAIALLGGYVMDFKAWMTGKYQVLSREHVYAGSKYLWYKSNKACKAGLLPESMIPFKTSVKDAFDWYVSNGLLK